jgi:hypothetical protein
MKRLLPNFSIIVSSIIILNNVAYGNEVVFLEETKPAPYSGILFPVEKANELRKMAIELDTLRVLKDSYEKSNKLYEESISLKDNKYNLLLEQNTRLLKLTNENSQSEDLQKIIWFALGVVATGFAVYGAKKITQ